MKINYSSILFFLLFVIQTVFVQATIAQTTHTGYFMRSQHNRSSLNPALRPEQGYIGLFGLNNIYANVNTNTLMLENFIFPASPKSQTFLHKNISTEKFLDNISSKNYANADFSYTLGSAGFYNGSDFWTIDLNIKAHADVNLPYDVFKFAKQGLSPNESVQYNLKDIQGVGISYAELGLGYSHPLLNNALVVGMKAKFLLGLGSMNFHIKKLTIDAGMDQWSIQSHATLEGTAPGLKPKYDENNRFDGIKMDGFTISGLGVGFDLGATYSLKNIGDPDMEKFFNRLTFSAALTDIGFISWSGKNSMYLATDPKNTVVTGNYNISFNSNDKSLNDQLKAIKDTIRNAINLLDNPEKENKSRTTALRMNMNLGMEYEFIKNKLSAGLLSSTYFNYSHHMTEYTLAGTYKPISWLEAGLSYSFIYSKFNTFGLALNIVPRSGMNVFLASDYVIAHVNSACIPTKSKALNFQFGLSVPIGSKKNTQPKCKNGTK